jgi:hypothetical protein
MRFWDDLLAKLRKVLGLDTHATHDRAGEGVDIVPLRPRVLLITFDPTLQSADGQQLSHALGWYHVDELVAGLIADLRECSSGLVEFEVVERILVDSWPFKADGFRYNESSYLACHRSRSGWHEPDLLDYEAIIDEFGLLSRVESDEIDEVWMFGFPYAGFFESIMVGPGAFWCNAPPIVRSDGISRRFVIMGFNYERDGGPVLESFGHRVESLLQRAWRGYSGEANLWERFTLYDKIAPGRANCGSIHYAPNSRSDYDWGNPVPVPSTCDDWLTFPNFAGVVRQVDCREWGNGDMRAHHKWWYRHLPHVAGFTGPIANNWWLYGVDPNAIH